MTKKKKILLGFLMGVVIVGAGLFTNIIKLPITKTINIEGRLAYNPNDDKSLMGASSNVFVAKVIERTGNYPGWAAACWPTRRTLSGFRGVAGPGCR